MEHVEEREEKKMIEKVFEIMDKEVLTQADMAYVATFNFYPYIAY